MGTKGSIYQHYKDEELLPLLKTGAGAAFDELYNRYGQKMFSYFIRMLWKNKEQAEDFTQDLFLKIIHHADAYMVERNFSTWLYSVANNMCKNEYRKQEVRKLHGQISRPEPLTEAINPDLRRFREAVHNCTNEMVEEKKTLYILRFQENLSVPDISKIMNIPEGTIKSRIFYLLKEMKEKLKAFENLPIYP
ncbi:MAG: sigma-70 family RNA polymerase sigma factor [Chitinophagaceae bacterium]|nr:MAG: sigma-70 family RNA polymerase sigma factor [Chitinophagaceae bacterium]